MLNIRQRASLGIEHSQHVRVDSTLSQEHRVHSGVPQGSVLGPILFIVYLTDLYQGIKTKNASFADDGNVYANPLIEYQDLQSDLNSIKRWTLDWLYRSYVRPKLEYAQAIWSPYYVKDIELIERVQRNSKT